MPAGTTNRVDVMKKYLTNFNHQTVHVKMKTIEHIMVRLTSKERASTDSGSSSTKRLSNREGLISLVSFIMKTSASKGMVVTAADIAGKIAISAEELNAYLDGTKKTPNKIPTAVIIAYEDLFNSYYKENSRRGLETSIVLIRNRGLAEGMNITLEDMAGKIGISREQMLVYLRDGYDAKESISFKLESAYKDVIKNVKRIKITEDIHMIISAGSI